MQFAETSFHLTTWFNNKPSVNDNAKFKNEFKRRKNNFIILICHFSF